MLSAIVEVLCKAKRLIILSDINGFYDSGPRLHLEAKRNILSGQMVILFAVLEMFQKKCFGNI